MPAAFQVIKVVISKGHLRCLGAVPLLTLVTALMICTYPAIMFAFLDDHIFSSYYLESSHSLIVPSATLILSHLAMIFLYYTFLLENILTHLIPVI